MGELLIGEIALAPLRPSRRAASIGGFDRGGALFERTDLVDLLCLRHAKVALAERGWIGHMPLLANRLYLGGLFAEEDATTPSRNEPIRAGLALALTDVQHHPQCPPWIVCHERVN